MGGIDVLIGGGEIGLLTGPELAIYCPLSVSFSSGKPGEIMVMSDIWEGVGVERRIEGGDCRAYFDRLTSCLEGSEVASLRTTRSLAERV